MVLGRFFFVVNPWFLVVVLGDLCRLKRSYRFLVRGFLLIGLYFLVRSFLLVGLMNAIVHVVVVIVVRDVDDVVAYLIFCFVIWNVKSFVCCFGIFRVLFRVLVCAFRCVGFLPSFLS